MKKVMLIIVGFLLAGLLIFIAFNYRSTANYLFRNKAINSQKPVDPSELPRIMAKAKQLVAYARKNGYDTTVVFVLNMRIASGKDRFFIYDAIHQKVVQQALVAHGRCNETVQVSRRYSNVVGGGCTALGKYKIGLAYQGTFGLAYKLHGLEASNNNAFERFVVLHAHECVPNNEVDPYPICQSDGCPTVSPAFLKILANIIDGKTKPVLLEIIDA
ncbi:hypothetical protein DBR32_09415 [Taibaiella sp. KBW10]|uniref:murein L,D-transpeptidase catalytic domain-containing protein n=1 Tax=Taibaiella sp. KBW10 TaxID=2153357 RepID=UPI000F597DFB|nr:murein L,D-transpeptidase catalytic domain family protein [Taibaiella sp. KBW10]RQO30919.1 hypothetical protein DBR32_09415 [Taibaiella sp. KBW10]